jgi:hypothetical protein
VPSTCPARTSVLGQVRGLFDFAQGRLYPRMYNFRFQLLAELQVLLTRIFVRDGLGLVSSH